MEAERSALASPPTALCPRALWLLLLLVTGGGAMTRTPIISTDKGRVQGFRANVFGKPVDIYYGIPFASPPVGNLRFKHPIQPQPWRDVLNATRLPNACVQSVDIKYGNFTGSAMWNPNTKIDEDCLYLNVWVPRVQEPVQNKAVLVWIYGGGFYSGSSVLDLYEARYLAAENDIIVVSMQYRMGPLGFLTLNHEECRGNAGMMDQRMALGWVNRNIHQFGGSPLNVTLMGESAGAVSVGLHMLSPLSRGFFDRAILQSGAPQAHWGALSMEEGLRRSREFAKEINCGDADTHPREVVQCLRRQDIRSFLKYEWYVVKGIINFPFAPVVDGHFLTETPDVYLARGDFKHVPVLVGSNTNEASFWMVYEMEKYFGRDNESLIPREKFYPIVEMLFKYFPHYPHELTVIGKDAIRFQYTHWIDPENQAKIRDMIEAAVGDFGFVCHVNKFAELYSQAGVTVYYYWFNQRYSSNPWHKWMGVLHGDEINFVFGDPLRPGRSYTEKEVELSRRMMRYWTNFAKTGDPNRGPGELGLGVWPPFLHDRQEYLVLDTRHLDDVDLTYSVRRGPRTTQCAFWNYYLPGLVQSTADINDVEREWKIEFHRWKTRYMVDWKTQFDNFLHNYERRLQTCGNP